MYYYTVVGETVHLHFRYLEGFVQCLVDADDFIKVCSYPGEWKIKIQNGKRYVVSVSENKGSHELLYLHHFLLDCDKENASIIHVNGNTLDNRKENLKKKD